MKICRKCGELTSDDNFHKMKGTFDGLHTVCKICRREDNLADYHKTMEVGGKKAEDMVKQRAEYKRNYGVVHKEELREKAKRYRERKRSVPKVKLFMAVVRVAHSKEEDYRRFVDKLDSEIIFQTWLEKHERIVEFTIRCRSEEARDYLTDENLFVCVSKWATIS